jgi:hypothetical protein
MNTVEDRLRDALRERAAHSPIDPDAWEQTVARVRRPVRARTWSRFVIPAAAAAAVIAIVAGATALTGLGGQRGSGAAHSTSPSASASAIPAPPGPGSYLIQQTPPVSAIVRVKMTIGGQTTWTFAWVGYNKGDRGEGLNLCSLTDGGGFDGGGGCGPAQLAAHQVAVYSGGSGSIRRGVSIRQVASVTAQLPGGRSVAGVVLSARGLAGQVWLVNYPTADSAQIVFRNASGHEIGHLAVAGNSPFPARPSSGGIIVFHYPAGVIDAKAGWMTAYLLKGGQVGFWSSDNADSVVSSGPASEPPAVGMMGGGYPNGAKLAEYFGYAHENVARVVLRLADGKQYSAQTFAAWPGSGLRLWAFSVPTDMLRVKLGQDVMMGYDSAGHVVWQLRSGSGG